MTPIPELGSYSHFSNNNTLIFEILIDKNNTAGSGLNIGTNSAVAIM